jgi:predicted membrane-bound mannosyltransferase
MPRGKAQPGVARGRANSVTPSSIFWLAAGVVLLVAVLLRAALLASGAFPFNADEAIVGLMARHILAGQWPTFFYGQAYLGSLDATFVAAAFALVGEAVLTIRIVQSALWLATILTTMLLTRTEIPVLVSAGRALLAIPTVNVTLIRLFSGARRSCWAI